MDKTNPISRVSVVLPSLDPDQKLLKVLQELLDRGFTDVILVNDGSRDDTRHYFDEAAEMLGVTVLTHAVNRGKGAALKTAFEWFLANRPDARGVVTVDGDGQHHPEDICACAEHMLRTGHVTLGCRDFTQSDVPWRSRFGNRTTSLVFKLFCGMTVSDTQTGLRAVPRETLETFLGIAGDRFEYETNMLLAMKTHGIPFDEVKIRTVYIEENKSSHFHVLRDSWRIYRLILAHFFRYTISSLVCAVIDTVCFYLFSALLSGPLAGLALTAAAGVGARVLSSLTNFFVNKRVVFRAGVSTGRAIGRYYALAVPQMAAQILLTQGLYTLLGVDDRASGLRTLWYVLVMVCLFFLSFTIQQRWVFAPSEKQAKKGLLGKFVRRLLLSVFTVVALAVVSLVLVLYTIFNGPSETARSVLTMSLLEPSATKWIPGLFLGDEQVAAIRESSGTSLEDTVSDASQVIINRDSALSADSDEWADYPDGIRIEAYSGKTFNAHIMIIRDPSRVYLGTSSDNWSTDIPGTRINRAIETEGASAAINAGAFLDNGTLDSAVGSIPGGLVFAGGVYKGNWPQYMPSTAEEGFAGFTSDDVLVVATSMTKEEGEELGIRDGCQFGPVLIMNGEISDEVYNGNSGYNPRTAIGQRTDGAVIFVCIDGRSAASIGGTYKDLIDIMVEYGAVNACNMDGGSSTVMMYRDTYGLYGTAGEVVMVNTYSLAQSEPRKMPDFWMVHPLEGK